ASAIQTFASSSSTSATSSAWRSDTSSSSRRSGSAGAIAALLGRETQARQGRRECAGSTARARLRKQDGAADRGRGGRMLVPVEPPTPQSRPGEGYLTRQKSPTAVRPPGDRTP